MPRRIDLFNGGNAHQGAEKFVCPRCNCVSDQYLALSRADNQTKICSSCGTDEALYCMIHTKEDFLEFSRQWMKEAGITFRGGLKT